MAHPKKEITAQPNYAFEFEFDQSIVFLRPLDDLAIAVLNAVDNRSYRVEVGPLGGPSNQQAGDISDGEVASPGEPERGCDAVCPSVLRLGFDSIEPPSLAGFTFGSSSGCNIILPLSQSNIDFTIHYNLKSGALMITANTNITVGNTMIKKRQSLLLIQNTILEFADMTFSVEFSELKHCLQAHKENYQRYSKRLEVTNARYMQSSALDALFIRHYRSEAILGKGGFGTVHLAVNTFTGDLVAMKMIIANCKTCDMKEIETMRNLHHKHIIQYYDSFFLSNGQLCILMELAVNDLNAHINAKPYMCISLSGICSIASQALLALKYLHNENITHRDIKPTNIPVTNCNQATDDFTIKLCDFGLASQKSRHHTKCGTDDCMAPEVKHAPLEKNGRLTSPYTKAVDIWAMGKVLIGMMLIID